MRIVCISDIHGYLPEIPSCDILLIAGDICPVYDHSLMFQQRWLTDNFDRWLNEQKRHCKYIVFIGGNHDFALEKGLGQGGAWPHYCNYDYPMKALKGIYYLQDSTITLDGLKIWGSPWQLRFFDWAFNLDEPELAKKYNLIPSDTDIIISHGPPYGYGDVVTAIQNEEEWPGKKHTGSPSLTKKIEDIKPKLIIYGHIHSGYGKYQLGDSILVNASYVDESYKPKNKPWVIEL